MFFKKTLLNALALFAGAAPASSATFAFLYALEADASALAAAGASITRTETIGNRTLRSFRVGEHTLIGVLMGSGQTESAVSTEAILARRAVDAVITTGVVGALDDTLKIGEIVVIDKIFAWQVGSHRAGAWAETSRSRPVITPWAKVDVPGPRAGVASGDVFIADESERVRLRSVTGMSLVDMNLHGIQTATITHALPALHLRIVSDHAGNEASEEFRKFALTYKGELGTRVADLIKSLPQDDESPLSYPALKRLAPAQ